MKKRGQVGITTCGHPERKYLANGKCGPCYQDEWLAKHGRDKKEFQWERNLKHRYGIGKAQYDALLVAQGDCCALCGSKTPQRKTSKRFFVDHSHVTNTVRGLVCHQCNRVIGIFNDNAALFDKVAAYLRTHE